MNIKNKPNLTQSERNLLTLLSNMHHIDASAPVRRVGNMLIFKHPRNADGHHFGMCDIPDNSFTSMSQSLDYTLNELINEV